MSMRTYDAPSDVELLDAWQRGSQAAAQQLWRRYYECLDRFFRTKVGDHDCDDLLQKTFLTVHKCAERFDRTRSFRPWLLGIANRVLLGHYRDRGREGRRFDPHVTSVAAMGYSMTNRLDAVRRSQHLLMALRRLPAIDQTIVELYYWDELSLSEIGVVVEMSESCVQSRLHRGRKHLKTLIDELAG